MFLLRGFASSVDLILLMIFDTVSELIAYQTCSTGEVVSSKINVTIRAINPEATFPRWGGKKEIIDWLRKCSDLEYVAYEEVDEDDCDDDED